MPKEREDKQFKSSSGICNIHAVIWYPDSDVYKKPVGVKKQGFKHVSIYK